MWVLLAVLGSLSGSSAFSIASSHAPAFSRIGLHRARPLLSEDVTEVEVEDAMNETAPIPVAVQPAASEAPVMGDSLALPPADAVSSVMGVVIGIERLPQPFRRLLATLFAVGFVCGFGSMLVATSPVRFSLAGAIGGAWEWGSNLTLLMWALLRLAIARTLLWATNVAGVA